MEAASSSPSPSTNSSYQETKPGTTVITEVFDFAGDEVKYVAYDYLVGLTTITFLMSQLSKISF